MEIRLSINGSLSLTFFNVDLSNPLPKWMVDGILDSLQMGEYVINLRDKYVFDINNLTTPIYRFEFEIEDDTEYEFEEIEDEN